jgi:hypothetical protein
MEHKMRKAIALAFVALPLVAQPAVSQSNPQGSPLQGADQSATQDESPQVLPQRLQQTLREAGYTDVEVVPSSFLVRAKDRNNNPVMMVINPHALLVVSAQPDSSGTTTGRGSGQPSGPAKK